MFYVSYISVSCFFDIGTENLIIFTDITKCVTFFPPKNVSKSKICSNKIFISKKKVETKFDVRKKSFWESLTICVCRFKAVGILSDAWKV